MNALLFGTSTDTLGTFLPRYGIVPVTENPDIVVCHGGDGTVLRAEHAYPGVPKLLLRASRVCKLCTQLTNDEVLERVAAGRYSFRELMKIDAHARGRSLTAVNDVIVHNSDPRHGIRYRLYVDGKPIGGEVIGDGIVAATPLGSTGYYRSITDSFFAVGIGVAFNNSTEQSDHMVVADTSIVKLSVVRGPAVIYADNQPETIELAENDEVVITRSDAVARLVTVEP
jgi:NAD+ kinase